MLRRDFFQAAAAGVASASALPGWQRSAVRRPNVIIVLTDDQGYGDLSSHGNPVLRTPNLDALRKSSARLTNFHVAPMCTPTRGQLMTGHHALENLAMNVSGGRALLRPDLPTMAELLGAAGYATGMFGKWHLGDTPPYCPEDRGFHEAVWFPSSHIGSAPDYWNNDYFDDIYRHNGRSQKYSGYCTDVFFSEAMQWMRSRHQERQPFFAYVATNAPHGPLFVPEAYQRPYQNQKPEIARFFGMIGNLDENIGKLQAMLAETGLADGTILIFLTDNGGTAGVPVHNAGMRGSKVTLWEGGHRVPCFIRWPGGGVKPGQDIGSLTEVQDLLPTLLDLCGVPSVPGERAGGVSLAPLLRGQTKTAPDRFMVIQFSRMHVGRPEWGDAAVLWNRFRLISNEALYDVTLDPGQTTNIISKHRNVAARMAAHYDRWWSTVEPRLSSFLPTHIGTRRTEPVLLSPAEWADVSFDQSREVRAGVRKNGVWHVQIERAGRYDLSLCRWPREAGLIIGDGAPPHEGECGSYPAGIAMPIASAEVAVGGRSWKREVKTGEREAVFTVDLPEGRAILQSFFRDPAGAELCGAYYLYAQEHTRPQL